MNFHFPRGQKKKKDIKIEFYQQEPFLYWDEIFV